MPYMKQCDEWLASISIKNGSTRDTDLDYVSAFVALMMLCIL